MIIPSLSRGRIVVGIPPISLICSNLSACYISRARFLINAIMCMCMVLESVNSAL